MSNVKTAVSLDIHLFQQAEQAAVELELSRSGLYARALAEFLHRYEAKRIQEKVNAVLADVDDAEDLEFLSAARRHLATLLPNEW